MRPQFHARKHLNSRLWMRDLQAGRRDTRLAFGHGFYGHTTGTSSRVQRNYLAAYWAESPEDVVAMTAVLNQGLDAFEATFGFASQSFIACNHVFPAELEEVLVKRGVTLLQGQRGQSTPQPGKGGACSVQRRYTGQRNRHGQCYSVRNVHFEPYVDPARDWVGSALKEIRQAFRLRRPAVVTSHRINYVGGMHLQHRDRSLRLLDDLLGRIRTIWPDAQFISSDRLAMRMKEMF